MNDLGKYKNALGKALATTLAAGCLLSASTSVFAQTFNGTGVGAIPDATANQVPGTPLVVSFAVSGITGNLTDLKVSSTFSPAHSWGGDVIATLKAPGGSPSFVLFGRIGRTTAAGFGTANDLGGPYVLADSSTVGSTNIWTAAAANPVPAGTYFTVPTGDVGVTNPPPATALNAAFSALTPAQINGTWTVEYTDSATGDLGTVSAAQLILTAAVGASADLSITKTDGVASIGAGVTTNYTITASNAGPDPVTGATVADTFPAACVSPTWTCIGAAGGTCAAAGAGNINDTVNLPSGGSVTYTAACPVNASAVGTLVNTATVTPPGTVSDPTPGNNSATDTDTIVANAPPVFAYSPAPASTVSFTGGSTVGSTGNASITVTIQTAGVGSGAASTTTTNCTAPTAPFTGFGQTVTAVGSGAISGSPLSGSCTLGAAVVTQTLTCSENQGGTPVSRTFDLSCPAGSAVPLTSTPTSGSTITLPQQTLGGPGTTATVAFQNPGLASATVNCTAPAATEFTVAPLSFPVPASGTASTTITFMSAVVGNFTGVLNCTSGAQAFTFNLAGSTGAPSQAIPTLGDGMRGLLALILLSLGVAAVGLQSRRS